MRFPRFSIPTYFLLLALPLSFFISSLGLAFLGREIIAYERQSIIERDTIYSRTVAEAVRHHVLNNVRFVEALAREAEDRPFTSQDLQPLVQRFVLSNKMFHNMYIANVDGVAIADYFPAGVTPQERRSAFGQDYRDRQYYKDLLARRTTIISDAVIGRVSGKPVVVIVAPIFGPDRSLVGFTEGALDLSPLLEIANAEAGEEVAVTYVVDASGQVVAHSNRDRVLELANVDGLPPARQALAGQRGWIDSYID
ncbi:MAG: cache domain-containing protein, partial [Bdellovibrionota bacterium]